MADKINRDRANDASIKTDDLNLGPIDDISLDFPGDGDEGVEFGKGRKPANPKKEFAIEFAKGLGGGVKSAGAAELRKVLPEGGALVDELSATFDDIKSLKEDLSRQLGPMTATIENATRKLLPKAEKYLPKKLYDKAKKKLDERAAARQGYSAPSKEQVEQEQIASEISNLFAAQAETSMAEMRDRKSDAMVDRAMGSVRHRQQVQSLTHVYDAVRSTELFHKTQHMAYMKKSLELKYKHVFIARDTFNLLQQSMKTFEGYFKGIMANSALPDMAKVRVGDYHRKNRTEKYGNMMSEALSNIRGKIMGKISSSVKNVMGQAGFLTDMIGMGADSVDMMEQMGGKPIVPGLLGKAAGFLGGSPIAKKLLGKVSAFTGPLNASLGGMKANMATNLASLREKWANGNEFQQFFSDFIPDAFAQTRTTSNDLLTKSKEAVPFDVITRQSITEIIPGYLGKIWHEVEMLRTGDETVEEKTFNVYERRFTSVGTLKQDLYDKAFGDEKDRRRQLNRTLALMQAGVARNRPDKDANDVFKGYEKDINRFCLNHAQYGLIFKPNDLRAFLVNDPERNQNYINKACRGFENDPAPVIEAICAALFTDDGELDKLAYNDLQSAITENYRKMDQYKADLAEANETYGLKQHLVSKMDGQTEKRLKEIVEKGTSAKGSVEGEKDPKKKAKLEKQIADAEEAQKKLKADSSLFSSIGMVNEMNFDEIVNRRADINYDEVDANQEDWARRDAYGRYQKFDKSLDAMRYGSKGKGLFSGPSKVGEAASKMFGHSRNMRNYDEVFNVDDKLKNAGKPEDKGPTLGGAVKSLYKSVKNAPLAEKLRAAGDKVAETAQKVVTKLSPEVKKQYSSAKKKVSELKKQFEETETGKKVAEQLEKLEKMYDEAAKQGDAAIQYIKDEGAFDDPVAFLKSIYGQGTASVKGWTESLPPLSDTEGWKDLLDQKKDDAVRFATNQAESLKKSTVGKTAIDIGGKIKSKATEIIGQAKESEAGKKATEAITAAKKTVADTLSGIKEQAKAGLRDAGIDLGGSSTPPPGIPPVPPIGATVDNVVEPEGGSSGEVVVRLDKILGVVTEWKTEATENQGTIFDAVAQVDEDIKNIKGGVGVGGALNEEELAKQLGKDIRKNSLLRRGLHAGKEAVFGTARGLGKMYTSVYGAAIKGAGQAAKGLGYAAGAAIKSGYKAAAGVGKWLTSKEDYVDIYVKGKEGGMPLVSARKQKDPDEGIFYKSSGKRVLHSRDIDEPCVDKRGQLVITEEDLKAGLVMNNSTPIGKIGAGALALAKGYFSVYGKALTAIGGVVKTVAKGLFGTGVERWQDVYRKDEVGKGPLVTARKQKEEGVYFFESGKKVEKTSDIHEPVCDRDKKMLISKEDIEHGLVDVNNKSLGSGGGGGALRALARGIGGALPGLGKFIGKAGSTMLDIYGKGYKGLMELGFGALKGAGKFLGRALGLELSGIGKVDEDLKKTIVDTNSVLHMMQLDLAAIAEKMHAKSVEGTAPTSAAPGPTGPTPSTPPTGESTAEDKTPKPEAATPAEGSSDDDPFAELKSKFTSKAKDLGASLKSRMSSIFRPKMEAVAPETTERPDGGKEVMTPEGTEITVEPAMSPVTESAIVGTETILGSIRSDLSGWFDKLTGKNTNPLDKDGDGDIDGSYADQMQNKKDDGTKRVDAKDMHKDVNWLKDDEKEGGAGGKSDKEGGGIFDLLKKIVPKKWQDKLEKFKNAFGAKAMQFAKGAGSWLMKGGRALFAGAAGLFSKSLPYLAKAGHAALGVGKAVGGKALAVGAKALPWVAKAGGAAMHGLGAMGSAAGGLLGSAGSAISGGLASMGGLAGIGSTLATLAGPAALAALAGYGIYRGIKGFSKKNTLENVGKSEGISKENQLTGEDRMYSALGLNSKIGAKTAKFASQALGIHGLIKGIRGNDNPLTDKEIEKGRTKLQRKIDKKMPGYDRILQEYEKAVEAGNWKRARELSGQEADGIIKSLWKNSIPGMVTKGLGNLIFGNKNEEMTKEEIEKTRAKFNSIIKKGGSAGKNAEKLLSKFEDYVAEQDWKNARKIAGAEKRGLFGKLFQDSKGNIKWGTVIGGVVGGIPGLIIGSLFNKADVNKPMTEEEVKKARERLQGLIKNGNKAAEKILDQFDEAVTEQNWKKARKLVGEEVQSNLSKLGGALKSTAKWTTRIATLGLSTLFESDQDKPMSDEEIKKFTDKMNFLIDKHGDKLAKKKLEKFEEAVAAQKWDKARQIAKMPHKSLIARGIKNTVSFWFGDDEKEMTEQEMTKFRESMQRKIAMGSKTAQKKLDAFEDAVGAQRWKRARIIAGAPDDGIVQKGAKALGKSTANSFRFFFGGDGKPMSDTEIEQARKEMGWAIQENKKGAQKRLDLFNDYVADEKWEKARKLAKMPYENAAKRVMKTIGKALFGDDKEALTPEEIDKFQKECEQRVEDGDRKAQKILDTFNSAVESENWKKARAISGMKNKGLFGEVSKGAKKVWDWFAGNSDYEDCQKIREELEEKAMEDETGLIEKGLEDFEKLVRRQKYNEAMDMAKDLLKMKPSEMAKKYKLKSDAYEEILKQGQDLTDKIDKKIEAEKGWFSLNRMRLKSLRSDLVGDQESWGQEFFDDIQERLSSITGEDQFADIDKPDDEIIKKGENLVKDIETSQGNYSWLGSPIIKTKLANLKSEVEGDMTAWCDETIETWKRRLKEIDKDYKGTDEQEDYEKGVTPVDDQPEYEVKDQSPFTPDDVYLPVDHTPPADTSADDVVDNTDDDEEITATGKFAAMQQHALQRNAEVRAQFAKGGFLKKRFRHGGFVKKFKRGGFAKFADGGFVDDASSIDKFTSFAYKIAIKLAKGQKKKYPTDPMEDSPWCLSKMKSNVERYLRECNVDYDTREAIISNCEEIYFDVFENGKPVETKEMVDEVASTSGEGGSSESSSEESGNGFWDNVIGAGKAIGKTAASPVTGLWNMGKGAVTGDFERDEYTDKEETTTEKVIGAPAKAISNGLGWIGKGIGSLFRKGGFARFADGGFVDSDVQKADKCTRMAYRIAIRKALSQKKKYPDDPMQDSPWCLSRMKESIGKFLADSGIDYDTREAIINNCEEIFFDVFENGKPVETKEMVDDVMNTSESSDGSSSESGEEGNGFWDNVVGVGKGLAKTAASPVTGLWNAGKGTVTGDFNRDEYTDEEESTAEKIVSAPGKAISNGIGWIGKGIGSLFAKGGYTKKFAEGGFSKSEITKYDQLVDDLEGDKDLSSEDTYKATYYSDGTQEKPFKKPTEDDVVQVYGSYSKTNYLKLLNLARHAYNAGKWAVSHSEVYDEEEEHAGGVLNPLNWFARGGFSDQSKWLTKETPSVDADGNPIVAGEAGTEAIMPIRSKPGNLLSRIGTKLGDILSGKPVGPMDDGASKASVHAGTDESEPMENMMANELAKTVTRQYRRGGFAKFAEGGFVENMKERGKTLGMAALDAVLGPILDTAFGVIIASVAPAAFVMLGPLAMTLITAIATVEAANAWEKGDYLKVAGMALTAGIAPAAIVAFFGLCGVGGALAGATFVTGAVAGDALRLLSNINKALLPEACQEYVDKAINSIGSAFSDVLGAGFSTAFAPISGAVKMGAAAATGDFDRAEYIREGESPLGTVLNAPQRAVQNAMGWTGKGIHAVGKGIGSLFGLGSDEEPKKEEFSEEAARAEALKVTTGTTPTGFARGGFSRLNHRVRDTSLLRVPSRMVSGAVDMLSPSESKPQPPPDQMGKLTTAIDNLNATMSQQTAGAATPMGGEDMATKLEAMTALNKQLVDLLESVLGPDGVKVSGIDTLTQVCAMSAQSGGGTPQPGPVQVIQASDDSQARGLDLRKRQM